MSKRLLLSVAVLSLAAMLVGFGTVAYWTSQASNDDNVFSTGTLIIGSPGAGANAGTINATNIAPGWSDSYSVTVNNLGTLDFDYTVTTNLTGDPDLSALLECEIDVGGAPAEYSGLCSGVSGVSLGSLAAGASTTMSVTVTLPASVTNVDLDPSVPHSSEIDFIFDATQI